MWVKQNHQIIKNKTKLPKLVVIILIGYLFTKRIYCFIVNFRTFHIHRIRGKQTSNGLTLWQQITKEFFNKVYPAETQSGASSSSKSPDKTHSTTHKSASDADDGSFADDSDDATETTTKRYRVTLTRGLSKYGPWGYLILGMLLCGGALLLCVLWGKHCNAQTINDLRQ